MSDRTRNLVVLLVVAILAALSVVAITARPTKEGLDLKGGVSLVYEARPSAFAKVDSESIGRAIEIMRDRVDRLGVAEPEIAKAGNNQIEVQLPGADNVEQAIRQVGTTAQLFFYDWEPNVVNENCVSAPTDSSVTGGPQAGNPGSGTISYYDAVLRASKCKATNEPDDLSHSGPIFYGVDTLAKKVLCGPQDTEAELRAECASNKRRIDKVVTVPRGYVVVQSQAPDGDTDQDKRARVLASDAYYVLKDDVSLKGTDIKDPQQGRSNGTSGDVNVNFQFTDSARKTWEKVTREIAERGQDQWVPGTDAQAAAQHFAIALDNKLISVPFIDFKRNPEGIDGRNGSEISGGFTIDSAQELAGLLKTGALPLKLKLISQSQVSATLGQQALNQGLTAAIAGFVIVALFLLIFYRALGVIAVAGLAVYALYLFALIKLIPITLTLPGIAGLILTIGVAADANIVIFERVKEEIRAGRSTQQGIIQGYKKGLAAIIDANVVTILVAFVLFMLATAGVKGFALTLGLGTITSLFTAVLATQAALGSMQKTKLLQSKGALGASKESHSWRIDFMGKSKWFFSFSGLILVICAFALSSNGLNLGIDFESGTRVKTSLTQKPTENQIRDALAAEGLDAPKIQRVTDDKELGGDGYQISLNETGAKVGGVKRILEQKFGTAANYQSQSIGPTFGNTIAKSAITAIIASLIIISVYLALRFDWKFAVPVLIALAHDLLITAGVYALTDREVTTSTVAALLTVLGFSLYDTIIVFDRVRENVPRMPQAAFSQIVNRSLSEVLTRSLATSFCALLPLLALYFFGGATLQDFAFALIIGTASGTYSSVFIATPVLTHWKETETLYRRRRSRVAAEGGGTVPPYATGIAATEVEVRGKPRPSRRLTAPETPEKGVSSEEFKELVRDIQPEVAVQDPEVDPNADVLPENLVLKDTPKRANMKGKKPRNRRHGR
ncbi:MAG TPA: protein translocase subunit SecD [Baekduia sp.]|nr:protein translocase subunit SecD [Baekduia sp.]